MTDKQQTVVHFVRHGEANNPSGIIYGRMPGFPLSETGRQMAKVAASSLAGRDIALLRTSPLERAKETAGAFATLFEMQPELDDRLIEPENRFEGQSFGVGDGALRSPRNWWLLRNPFLPSWGEPYVAVVQRMRAVLDEVRIAAAGKEAVCVSHQLAIEVLRRSLRGRRLWHDPRRRMCTLASITSFTFLGNDLASISYAEPAIDLVPAHLRAHVREGY